MPVSPAISVDNSHLRGALAVFLPMMDEESGSDDEVPAQTYRKAKGKTGKLCTADTTIIYKVPWLQDMLYMCSGQLAVYEEL